MGDAEAVLKNPERGMNRRLNKTAGEKNTGLLKKIIKVLAYTSLAAAFIYGISGRNVQVYSELMKHYPPGTELIEVAQKPLIYKIKNPAVNQDRYVSVSKSKGWGGRIVYATEIDSNKLITKTILIKHMETPSFYARLLKNDFHEQFTGKKITDSFIVHNDIDAVSGATVSSKAITKAIRNSAHSTGEKIFGLEIKDESYKWSFGIKEASLIIIYIFVLFGSMKKIPYLRYVTMAVSLILIGFWWNSPVSLSQIASIPLGYVPSLKTNLFWWLLVPGTILMTLLMRKNLYCYWMCPFGTLQEITSKISGINIKVNPVIARNTKYVINALLWFSLMIIFISANPASVGFEPFSTIFGFEGAGVQWFILPVVLFSSFAVKRFWCRFFCPVGGILNTTFRAGRKIEKKIRG